MAELTEKNISNENDGKGLKALKNLQNEQENKDIVQQEIVVRLDSSIKKNSPLFFEPTKKSVKTKIGKNNLVFFIFVKSFACFNS